MSIYEHISRHFDGFKLHISNLLCDLIQIERDRSKQLETFDKKLNALHQENLDERKLLRKEFSEALERLDKIYAAVVPEAVTTIHLATETGDHMDIAVGQTSTLTFQAFGASGNPTVPVGQPSFNSTNSTDFTVEPANGVVSVSASAAAGATTDVSVTVDGITSNTVSYTVAAAAAEPVASVVLTGSTPA